MEKLDASDWLGLIGGVICIIAGGYLFLSQTQNENSYLMTIAHGMGMYFVGKGLFILQSVLRQSAQTWFLHSIRDAEVEEPSSTAPRPDAT